MSYELYFQFSELSNLGVMAGVCYPILNILLVLISLSHKFAE